MGAEKKLRGRLEDTIALQELEELESCESATIEGWLIRPWMVAAQELLIRGWSWNEKEYRWEHGTP